MKMLVHDRKARNDSGVKSFQQLHELIKDRTGDGRKNGWIFHEPLGLRLPDRNTMNLGYREGTFRYGEWVIRINDYCIRTKVLHEIIDVIPTILFLCFLQVIKSTTSN